MTLGKLYSQILPLIYQGHEKAEVRAYDYYTGNSYPIEMVDPTDLSCDSVYIDLNFASVEDEVYDLDPDTTGENI